MTASRCDLAVLDEQLAINAVRRSDGESDVTVSIGVADLPDTGSGLQTLIVGSGTR